MSSNTYSSARCSAIVYDILESFNSGKELCKNITNIDDINQLVFSCGTEQEKENNDFYSKPMVWIGFYIATASFLCILAMAADLFHGFRSKKFWFPCKYFTLNAASITVITVAMKLPVDLSSEMPTYIDQAAKVGSLAFMCVMMVNLMPSLASMDNKTLLTNMVGLCVLVITMIVNICIQITTRVISHDVLNFNNFNFGFDVAARIYIAMIIVLLVIMISSSLTIPTTKEFLESKYRATNKKSLIDQRLQHVQMSTIEKLRQHVRRNWVMAETGSPQFVMASNPLSTASGVICVLVMVINVLLVYMIFPVLLRPEFFYLIKNYLSGSSYKWSTIVIVLTQFIGVIVGTIAPISRCFLVFNFKLGTNLNRNYFMLFKIEKYWTQKLHEWKQNHVLLLLSNRRSRGIIYNSKSIILSLCIVFQKVVVILCKVTWFIVTLGPICVAYCLKSMRERWFIPPITPSTNDIDEDLNNYVLQFYNQSELAEKTLKGISKSMYSFISKVEKEQNNNLLEFLDKSTGFKGVQIFDVDHVKPLLPIKLVNSWSLPIVTLTCIAVCLPNIRKDEVERLLRRVGEGLSFTHLVEESLNTASEYVNIRKTSRILWLEVEHRRKWLDNTIETYCFEGKTTSQIVEWYYDKAKQIVTEIKESTTEGEIAENPPHMLIAANSMYRITQTILLRYQSNIEPITKKRLFAHLNGMIADIFSACFTNIPRVITMRCNESVIEKRESSVKVAAKLLGRTTKIIEMIETLELPIMDDDKMAYIDEWRLYLKQVIP